MPRLQRIALARRLHELPPPQHGCPRAITTCNCSDSFTCLQCTFRIHITLLDSQRTSYVLHIFTVILASSQILFMSYKHSVRYITIPCFHPISDSEVGLLVQDPYPLPSCTIAPYTRGVNRHLGPKIKKPTPTQLIYGGASHFN